MGASSVEDLRKRSIDIKTDLGRYYSDIGIKALNDLKNVCFLVLFGSIAYIGATNFRITLFNALLIISAVFLGFLSYIFRFLFSYKVSHNYKRRADLFLKANMTEKEYYDAENKERTFAKQFTVFNKYYQFEIACTVLFFAFVLFIALTIFLSNSVTTH